VTSCNLSNPAPIEAFNTGIIKVVSAEANYGS
jgi:hypothetical protein